MIVHHEKNVIELSSREDEIESVNDHVKPVEIVNNIR